MTPSEYKEAKNRIKQLQQMFALKIAKEREEYELEFLVQQVKEYEQQKQ